MEELVAPEDEGVEVGRAIGGTPVERRRPRTSSTEEVAEATTVKGWKSFIAMKTGELKMVDASVDSFETTLQQGSGTTTPGVLMRVGNKSCARLARALRGKHNFA